jgi:hypothetical protein
MPRVLWPRMNEAGDPSVLLLCRPRLNVEAFIDIEPLTFSP